MFLIDKFLMKKIVYIIVILTKHFFKQMISLLMQPIEE